MVILDVITCVRCGWEYLKRAEALVPRLDVLTDGRKIPLEYIALCDHALCHRCVRKAIKRCPEAEFYPLLATQKLIDTLLARQEEKAAREAKKAAQAEADRIAAEAKIAEAEKFRQMEERKMKAEATCITSRPILPAVEVKTVDKNGHLLKGAAAHSQVLKALRPFMVDAKAKKAAKESRRAADNAARERRIKQSQERMNNILQRAS